MPEVNKEKLKQLLRELEKLKLTREAGPMAGLLFDLSSKLEGVKELEERFDRTVAEIKSSVPDLDSMFKSVKGQDGRDSAIPGPKGEEGERGEEGKPGIDGKDGLDGKNGKDGIGGRDGINGKNGEDAIVDETKIIETIEADLPKLGEKVRDSLELLQDEDKLKIESIKDLRKELNELRRLKQTIIGGAGATGGHVVKAYDISPDLNGSTKTFSLPAFWRIISIVSSSFPTAFRLTTDYTVDGSLFQITFTSEIDAGTTLASGQTIIITYSE